MGVNESEPLMMSLLEEDLRKYHVGPRKPDGQLNFVEFLNSLTQPFK